MILGNFLDEEAANNLIAVLLYMKQVRCRAAATPRRAMRGRPPNEPPNKPGPTPVSTRGVAAPN